MTAPDWLTARDGSLLRAADGECVFVMLAGSPQYRLTPRPAEGQVTCSVVQSNNGRRLDAGTATYPDEPSALRGGLDELRRVLGW